MGRFDTSMFLRGYNPEPIQSPQNALMQGLEMQRAQGTNALQQVQLQYVQQEKALALQKAREDAAMRTRQQNALMQMPSPQMEASQQALAGGGGPTMANAARMPQVDPRMQALHGLAQAGLMPVGDYVKQRYPAPDLKALGTDERLVDLNTGAVKLDGTPKGTSDQQNFAAVNADPRFGAFLREQANLKAPKNTTNLNVNTAEKGLLTSLSGKVGDDVMNSSEAARGAQKSLSTVSSMRQALASAKAITGTAANQRTALAQLGYTLGIGPADNPETLAKTREMMMGFGQLELDAAAQMKGQGQITESERAILRRAAAGDITLTVPEIETVLNVSEKRAKAQISRNARNVDNLKKMPNAGPLVPFLEANGQSTDGPEFKMPTIEDIAAEARRRGLGGK